jgi:hypothetical protein
MQDTKEKVNEDFDIEDIKIYMGLSVEKKLNYLEHINDFFKEAMPQKSKDAWEILKQAGW